MNWTKIKYLIKARRRYIGRINNVFIPWTIFKLWVSIKTIFLLYGEKYLVLGKISSWLFRKKKQTNMSKLRHLKEKTNQYFCPQRHHGKDNPRTNRWFVFHQVRYRLLFVHCYCYVLYWTCSKQLKKNTHTDTSLWNRAEGQHVAT